MIFALVIPLPSTQGRMQLFKLNMQGINCCEDLNWDYLVKNTEGFSGADIACVTQKLEKQKFIYCLSVMSRSLIHAFEEKTNKRRRIQEY